jgi:hypothetical protein
MIVLTCRALGHRQVTLGGSPCCPGVDDCWGHTALEGADLPYCATWTEMLVPWGHLRVTSWSSHPARWKVLSVPDNRAAGLKQTDTHTDS